MGAKVSTDRDGWIEDSMSTNDGSGTTSKQNSMHDEIVEVRKEGESTEELSVHFGYQCQSNHGSSGGHQKLPSPSKAVSPVSSEDSVSVTLLNGFRNARRNSSFSSLSGAALGANATLANSSICNGKLGEEILPGLDSPKTFRKMDSLYRTSSLKSDLSSLTILNNTRTSIGSQSVPAELGDLSSYATTFENANRSSFLNAKDVQMAGGAAGEDRVQAVCSEDKGWLFCGIYDGFNGRDAADFLAGTLYENIGLHLRLLEHKAQKRQALLDADDSQNSGDEDVAMIDDDLIGAQQATSASNSADSDMDTNMDDFGVLTYDGVSSHIESSDLPQFRQGVLDGLRQALMQTESDFLEKVEQEMHERPDLVMVGSCVLVVLMYGRSLYTLNLGDSRAVLATAKAPANNAVRRPGPLYAVELTQRHVVEDARERERVISEHPDDPRAICNGRLKGKLRVTRAFGAGYLKKASMNNALMGILRVKDLSSPPYLTVTPAVSRLEVQPGDKFVVIGSDGLFDFFTNEEVVDHINRFLIEHPTGDPAKYMVDQLLLRAANNAGAEMNPFKELSYLH
uniref:protein-serine/threonine phosphatase n=1 Tax=Physcomitrium patens TaxID=3218 RepID=A0A7I4B133_PHYPA